MTKARVLVPVEELEKRIGYTFTNRALVERALTHRSFSQDHNERLEFLGDSVLNCVIGQALFLRDKHFDEGVLSRARANFVCEKSLYEIAKTLELGSFIRMGEGELKTGGIERPSILADALEAVFGAVFMEGGFEKAQEVILRLFEPVLSPDQMAADRLSKDAKTLLQECLQSFHFPLPEYSVVKVEGAAHNQLFYCSCKIDRLNIEHIGTGKNRRAAEQEAAAMVLDVVRQRAHK
ncbi:MAG: ribonuclease III [Sutterellaceae bacterium]|nr:ribonuclease III [Sutterellaceae bacterium]